MASSSLLASFGLGPITSPLLAIRANPIDPYGKVLIITGADSRQLLLAAQALALKAPSLQGNSAAIPDLHLPSIRLVDDAPRWSAIQSEAPLWGRAEGSSRDSDGTSPTEIFLRIPPDLYAADKLNVKLHLNYSYNALGLTPGSALLVQANGSAGGAIPLKPGSRRVEANVPLPVLSLRPFSNSISTAGA